MGLEPMEEFEQELKQALERRAAPVSLKGRIMARRAAQRPRSYGWQRLAAAVLLAAVLGGAAGWDVHVREERRRGEAAREQVLTALRITGHALNHMNRQLAAHDRAQE